MKKIFNYLAVISLLIGSFTACDNNDEVFEYPDNDTYTLSVNFTSLAGEIEVLLDGEVMTNPYTGVPLTGSNITTQTPEVLLVSKGERKLELREAGSSTVLWDSTFVGTVGQACAITKFWNGEAIMNDIYPADMQPGEIAFYISMDFAETDYTAPMDIELYYEYMNTNDYMDYITEPLAKVKNYVPGSGVTSLIRMRAPYPDGNGIMYENLYLRLYKAGTSEPYHTLMTIPGGVGLDVLYHYGVPGECWVYPPNMTYWAFIGYGSSSNFILNISETEGSYKDSSTIPGFDGEVRYSLEFAWGAAPFSPAQ